MQPALKNKNRFTNPYQEGESLSFGKAILWLLGYYRKHRRTFHVPDSFIYPNDRVELNNSFPPVRWLNHSTFHIHRNGVSILTDPIWSDRCSPFSFLGPKRRHCPPFTIDSLKEVDIVLVSHNHYDHLDSETITELHRYYPQIHWYVPKGLRLWFQKRGIHQVTELDWWQEVELTIKSQKVKVSLVPSQHSSGRGIFDQKHTLWGGFVVELIEQNTGHKQFYFAGDTGYNNRDFKAIGRKYGEMDLSLIPIGAYHPRKLMKSVHVNPEEASCIHQEVKSKLSVAMHWKTFKLTDELMRQPPYDLYRALLKEGVDPKHFRVLDPGQVINW